MGDVLGLLIFAGIIVAVLLACRRIKSNHQAATAAAVAEAKVQTRQELLARIGASVVVHNHNGDGLSLSAREHDNDVVAAYLDEHAAALLGERRRGADDRLGAGVPVGLHPVGAGGDVRAQRAASLAPLIESDEAYRVLRAGDGC